MVACGHNELYDSGMDDKLLGKTSVGVSQGDHQCIDESGPQIRVYHDARLKCESLSEDL